MLTNSSEKRKWWEGPFLVAMRSFADDTLRIMAFATVAGMVGNGVWDEYLKKLQDAISPELPTLNMVRLGALSFCFLVAILLAASAIFRFADTIRDSAWVSGKGKTGIFFGYLFLAILVLLALLLNVAISIAFVSAWKGGC